MVFFVIVVSIEEEDEDEDQEVMLNHSDVKLPKEREIPSIAVEPTIVGNQLTDVESLPALEDKSRAEVQFSIPMDNDQRPDTKDTSLENGPEALIPEVQFTIPMDGLPKEISPEFTPHQSKTPSRAMPRGDSNAEEQRPKATLEKPTEKGTSPEILFTIAMSGDNEPYQVGRPEERGPRDIHEQDAKTIKPQVQFNIPFTVNNEEPKVIIPSIERSPQDIPEKKSSNETPSTSAKPTQGMPEIQFTIPGSGGDEPRVVLQPVQHTPGGTNDGGTSPGVKPTGEIRFTIPSPENESPGKVPLDASRMPEIHFTIPGIDGETPLVVETPAQQSNEEGVLRASPDKAPSFIALEPEGRPTPSTVPLERKFNVAGHRPTPGQENIGSEESSVEPTPKMAEVQFVIPADSNEKPCVPSQGYPEQLVLVNGHTTSETERKPRMEEVSFTVPLETSPDTVQTEQEGLPDNVVKPPLTFSEVDVRIPMDDNQGPVKIIQKPLESVA